MPLAHLALSQIRAFLFRKLVRDKMALGRREAATHTRACYGSSASTILGLRKNGGRAGINRSEAGDERALRERSNEPLGPEFGDELSRGNHRSINRG
jgi:hypothetical protein